MRKARVQNILTEKETQLNSLVQESTDAVSLITILSVVWKPSMSRFMRKARKLVHIVLNWIAFRVLWISRLLTMKRLSASLRVSWRTNG